MGVIRLLVVGVIV